MQRYTPYVSVLCALLLGVFIAVFSRTTAPATAPITASTTTPYPLSVLPSTPSPAVSLPSLQPEVPVTTASVQQTTPTAPAQTSSIPSAPKAISVPTPPAVNSPLSASAVALRLALVNIICYVPANSGLHSISGSGVFIDPKGVILTTAHVAQYFLLADRGVSCTIRTGSPAVDSYKASLMYISPAWLKANASVLTEASPGGTGEYDFAFLAVTSSATAANLPASFPSVVLATESPSANTPVTIASYGAQSLGATQIQSALFPTVVFDSVKDVFTFATTTIDVLAFGGTAAAQEGSSGGGVANSAGRLLGTLTTSSVSGDISTRILHAITAAYIRSEYTSETEQSLDSFLAQSPTNVATNFSPQISALEAVITARLP